MLNLTLLLVGDASVAAAPFLLNLVHELFRGRYVLESNQVTIEIGRFCLLTDLLYKSVYS